MGLDPGIDVAALWDASDVVDEHIGDEPVAPLAPRIAVRAAQHDLPAGLVAGVDATLRAQGAGDRLDEVLEELDRIRAEVGWPPLAAPIGQVLASQALLNVLSASRYLTIVDELRALVSGRFGTPPEPIDPAVVRAVELTHDPRDAGGRRAVAEGAARGGGRHGGERGRAAAHGALRRGRRAAAAQHPRPRDGRRRRARVGRQGARRADPRGRAHRAGVRDRRGDDRGGRHARLRALDARRDATVPCPRRRRSRSPSREPRRCRRASNGVVRDRVADGRHVLPRARAGLAAVRRGGRRRRARARRSASSRR